ncbi:MAG: MBL fold metallo-hydrolase [Aminivibrio sp.]|jgi:7,8-dihydropterin-6-yl-methyl-4-(beta-D-ribofuranosyl)aminobenzene 5'-phosphate synthase
MVRITTLIENSPGEHHGLLTEHGISFCVEKDGRKILFDTGQSGAFLQNAAKLAVDLTDVECAILSHGHYDHSGGLRSLAEINTGFTLRTGEGFFTPKYGFRRGAYDFLGNDFDEAFLKEKGIKHRTASSPLEEILPGVFILADFPRINHDETINPRFVLEKGGAFEADPFNDEILLAVETKAGIAVLLGCSHPGMRNMLDAVKARLKAPIAAVLGGTHLVEAKGGILEKSLEYLKLADIPYIGMSHCTGKEAMDRLEAESQGFFRNVTGSSLWF